MPGPEVTIYTDGACSVNPGPGGYAAILVDAAGRRELSGGYARTTNNRMELLSVIRALESLPAERTRVAVTSDSRYVVDMVNGGHAKRWRAHGWMRNKGKDPAQNPDLWACLLDLCGRHEVRFIWVRGHAENAENARCDELAVAARQAPGLPPDEGFERLTRPTPAQQLSFL